jgi:hypothetical protein
MPATAEGYRDIAMEHTPLIYVSDMNCMRLVFVCALPLRIGSVLAFVLVI